ncbi:MAG: septum formation inhibitor Maf [Betaproteobacteria bacterium HGW-Betaproteobacteria-22]|nr:MAG: septum formation inhibitor Maf [Betaproteobacteria bacterium HGW-Betaproteobacteria-22]
MIVPRIILASRSPRRVDLLKQIGIECEVCPADINESVLVDELPQDYVLRVAREKALACASLLGSSQHAMPILAADTTVALLGSILGKPEDAHDARAMLRRLSGKSHQVHTAVALYVMGAIEVVISTTQVEMAMISDAQIAHYLATGEHVDKAGSYGIQGLAGAWISKIEGSYTGVMGLPVYETAALLRKYDIFKC